MLSTSWRRYLPVFFLLAATALILRARDKAEILPAHLDLSSFPVQLGDWKGRDLTLTPGELEVLGPGQFLMRDYVNSVSGSTVNLFIAFFPSQRSGDTIHSPKNCIPGSGWVPIESGRIIVPQDGKTSLSVNRYVVARGTEKDLVFYWYQAHGRAVPSEYWAKLFLVEDAIRMHRTDGAMVRVVVPVISGRGGEPAQATGLEFIHRLLPMLDDYIPR